MKRAKLIKVDAYYGIFDALTEILKASASDGKRKIVFCEEKVSLMAERRICEALRGTFDIDVFSFGKYIRTRKKSEFLSKEGSAMVCKRVIDEMQTSAFGRAKNNLAPTVYDLIAEFKSAKVTPEDLSDASENTDGILKNKLTGLSEVFSGYEKFLKEKGLKDQNTLLGDLPDLIRNDDDIKGAQVFLIGYQSWTAQAKETVSALLDIAEEVIAISVGGDNRFLFLNETVNSFTDICAQKKIPLEIETRGVIPTEEGRVLSKNLFSPRAVLDKKSTDKVFLTAFRTPKAEIESVAATIKKGVVERGERYKNFTVCVPSTEEYGELIKTVFTDYEIPFFLDEKKRPLNNPLITLILSYCELFIKNFERDSLRAFYSNPIFCDDKKFTDAFYAFTVTYGINYNSIKKEFVFGKDDPEFDRYEEFRKKICSFACEFDEKTLLEKLGAKDKINGFCKKLKELGEFESAAVNAQIYDKITGVIEEMRGILGDKIPVKDFKTVFLSGVNALELSIIPQYQDAVFIGGYKETAVAAADRLFAVGLTSDVPAAKDDVALLTDGDIARLSDLKIVLENKIKVINDREKESVGNALTAFKQQLFLSYPSSSETGGTNLKSDIINSVEKCFIARCCVIHDDYLTVRQGLKSFARECGNYLDGRTKVLGNSQAYYILQKDKAEPVLRFANRDMKVRLEGSRDLVGSFVAPTKIENFYSCPYKAFLSGYLKIEQADDGEVNPLSVGNFVHDIFGGFIGGLKRGMTEKEIENLIEGEIQRVEGKEEYKRYTAAPENAFSLSSAEDETRAFCRRLAEQYSRSEFENIGCEVDISQASDEVTPIDLGGTTVSGRVDRADGYTATDGTKYLRVIDYKTGSEKKTNGDLLSGKGLQLFLYANAYKDRALAGAYYYMVDGSYGNAADKNAPVTVGRTLKDDAIVAAQDNKILSSESDFVGKSRQGVSGGADANEMNALKKYAFYMAEQAVCEMKDGKIIPSPLEGVCENCQFKGMCENAGDESRKVSAGQQATNLMVDAVKEKEGNI